VYIKKFYCGILFKLNFNLTCRWHSNREKSMKSVRNLFTNVWKFNGFQLKSWKTTNFVIILQIFHLYLVAFSVFVHLSNCILTINSFISQNLSPVLCLTIILYSVARHIALLVSGQINFTLVLTFSCLLFQ
jgi:hypothetical protein